MTLLLECSYLFACFLQARYHIIDWPFFTRSTVMCRGRGCVDRLSRSNVWGAPERIIVDTIVVGIGLGLSVFAFVTSAWNLVGNEKTCLFTCGTSVGLENRHLCCAVHPGSIGTCGNREDVGLRRAL